MLNQCKLISVVHNFNCDLDPLGIYLQPNGSSRSGTSAAQVNGLATAEGSAEFVKERMQPKVCTGASLALLTCSQGVLLMM